MNQVSDRGNDNFVPDAPAKLQEPLSKWRASRPGQCSLVYSLCDDCAEKMKSKVIFLLFTIFSFCWVESPNAKSPQEEPADRILIEKAARKLTLYRGQNVIRTYRVALGSHPTGKKQCRGDKRTPEGRYIIDGRNKSSRYHRSLHISYPNAADRDAARRLRCNPGGDIMIHGLTNGYGWVGKLHTSFDWTLGCIAVTNQEIEEIWNLVPNGTPIVIYP